MGIKSIFILSIFILNGLVLTAQNSETTLRLFLKGKEYEKITLVIDRDKNVQSHVQGKKGEGDVWAFHIPDSICRDHSIMEFIINKNTMVGFSDSPKDKKKTRNGIGSFSLIVGSTTTLKALHLSSDTFFSRARGEECYMEDFLLTFCNSPDFKQFRDRPGDYCRFYEGDYDENLKRYIKTTRKHPSSHVIAYSIYVNIYSFSRKEDIRQVFDCLTDANQNSYWGEKIRAYLDLRLFPEIQLPVFDSDRQESVIRDATKYNLVVFSASWCATCHKLIPLLKEIYRDLKGDLEITYISMDEISTQKQWGETMVKYEIPWRSLIGAKQLDRIRDVYVMRAIPDSYLVFPNGEFERIDVRKPDDKNKLYELVKPPESQSKE